MSDSNGFTTPKMAQLWKWAGNGGDTKEQYGVTFENEAMLPIQMARLNEPQMSPERWLMLAVLEDAVKIAIGKAQARADEVREARDWIMSTDTAWPMSFSNCCDAIAVDAEWFRNGIQREWQNYKPFRRHVIRRHLNRQVTRLGIVSRKVANG